MRVHRALRAKGIDFNSLTYQTKDLGSMGTYEVREDGYLWEHTPVTEYVAGNPKAKDVMDRIGRLKTIEEKWTKRDSFTGYIEFYEDVRNDEFENDYWVEYVAHVVKGRVKSVKVIKWESTPNSYRKNIAEQNRLEMEMEMQHHTEFNRRWYVRAFYHPYCWILHEVFHWYRWTKGAMRIPSSYTVEDFLMNPVEFVAHKRRIARLNRQYGAKQADKVAS